MTFFTVIANHMAIQPMGHATFGTPGIGTGGNLQHIVPKCAMYLATLVEAKKNIEKKAIN